MVFHVFHKVSWCSGYHISLTPKRSRVRTYDKLPVSYWYSLRTIPSEIILFSTGRYEVRQCMYRPHSSRNYSDAVGESHGAMSTPHVCITALRNDRCHFISLTSVFLIMQQYYRESIILLRCSELRAIWF